MKIMCAGGGTLGSVTPLLAVIEAWREEDPKIEVCWLGTYDGPEQVLVESASLKFIAVPSGKLRRYFSLQNILDLFLIVAGFVKCVWLMARFRPQVLLTAGSYVAVPAGCAAGILRIPVCVHQQDVKLGLANKLLAPLAKLITVTFPDSVNDFISTKIKPVVTGNPVRAEFLQKYQVLSFKRKLGLDLAKPVVVVIGGGTGADFLNKLVWSSKKELVKLAQIVHLTGNNKKADLVASSDYYLLPFTTDTFTVLASADVVVTRAGLGTLTELGALGKAAVVVPIPYSHQEANARLLASFEAAVVLDQINLTSRQFIDTLSQLLNKADYRDNLGLNLRKLFIQPAATRMVEEIRRILNYN